MIFGYTRISTKKDTQTTERQLLALKQYSITNDFEFDEIIEERVSGIIKAESRLEYSKLKNKLRNRDILVITDLDRLGRNADDVIMELKNLKLQGVRIIALDMPYMCDWDKANDSSIYDMVIDIVVTIKAHMAQQERQKTVERINQGLDVARAKGKKLGRPEKELPKEFRKYYDKMVNKEINKVEMAKLLGVSRKHLYTIIEKYNNEINRNSY